MASDETLETGWAPRHSDQPRSRTAIRVIVAAKLHAQALKERWSGVEAEIDSGFADSTAVGERLSSGRSAREVGLPRGDPGAGAKSVISTAACTSQMKR